MEKGSFSERRLRWLDEVVDVGERCQKLFFSVGEGWREMTQHCINGILSMGRDSPGGRCRCHSPLGMGVNIMSRGDTDPLGVPV